MSKIKRNRAKCKLCGDILESTYTHDSVTCKCGNLSVDGGHDYIKRSFKRPGSFIELSEYEEDKS